MSQRPPVHLDRLRSSREIAAVLRGGQRRAGRLVVLHTAPSRGSELAAGPTTIPAGEVADVVAMPDVTNGNTATDRSTRDTDARVAVVASRKVGTAVARNRAKRLLREASRRVDWQPGTDLVLVARNACASSTMDDVLAELEELAGQLAVTRPAA